MVIAPKADVGATAVANPYRLVLGNTKSSRATMRELVWRVSGLRMLSSVVTPPHQKSPSNDTQVPLFEDNSGVRPCESQLECKTAH